MTVTRKSAGMYEGNGFAVIDMTGCGVGAKWVLVDTKANKIVLKFRTLAGAKAYLKKLGA